MFSPIVVTQANAVLKRGMAVRWRDFKATIRDVFTPVYIVILLVILKIVIGEESLPPVPKLPATTTSCAPSDPTVAMHAVCWHYPVRTPLEKVVGYVPRASPVVASLMDDVMRRVSVAHPDGEGAPHYLSAEPLTLRGFDTAADLEAFYRAQPHKLYAGVVFPRFTLGGGGDGDGEGEGEEGGGGGGGAPVLQWNGTHWFEADPFKDRLLVDERFHVMINGSYIPNAGHRHAALGDECRPLFAADGSTYSARGRASLPTYCSSMTYLSTGFLHVQSAVSSALGSHALGNASCPSGLHVDVSYEQGGVAAS